MDFGMFSMPLRPPAAGREATKWFLRDIENFVAGDRLGYAEGWMGEHYTIPWEPIPAVDIFLSNVFARTERIRLGTGVVLLPMHDPRHVALRIAYLDHISEGRLNFGIGSGGAPTDFGLFDIDFREGEHRERFRESIGAIMQMWTEEMPFEHNGKFWQYSMPEAMPEVPLYHHIRCYQDPHPPIAVAGLHKKSETLVSAGENGWIPMSINYLPARNLLTHWEAIEEGAARAGRTPDRAQWRIAREVYIARTDAEAREKVLNGPVARAYVGYMKNVLGSFGALELYKDDPEMPDEALTPEYLVDKIWVVGSPDTVADKLTRLYEDVGGFGTLLQIQYTYDPWEDWLGCMELLATEVMPGLAHLKPEPAAEAAE